MGLQLGKVVAENLVGMVAVDSQHIVVGVDQTRVRYHKEVFEHRMAVVERHKVAVERHKVVVEHYKQTARHKKVAEHRKAVVCHSSSEVLKHLQEGHLVVACRILEEELVYP